MAKSPAANVGVIDGGSKGSSNSSPEFEFWKFRNFSFSDSRFPAADELIVDGVLLPFTPAAPAKTVTESEPEKDATPAEATEAETEAVTPSKRWRDIFRLLGGDEKKPAKKPLPPPPQVKERRSVGSGTTDLNINIWPFSRSRSAGCAAPPRPKFVAGAGNCGAAAARKSSSAPCSRSNSGGESKSAGRRATPPSPARGVHVGRSSPVWQVRRRPTKAKEPAATTVSSGCAGTSSGGSRVRVINLNVPLCMGVRQEGGGGSGGCRPAGGGAGGGLFGLRSLFSKKVY